MRAPGADASVGLRIVITLTPPSSETQIPIYLDILGFTLGPTGVSLSAMSVVQPEPATTEQQLLSLLLRRAEATPL